MFIYNYHPDTLVFLGVSEADPSPLEPGKFLLPAHSTSKKPPSFSSKEYAVFKEGNWEVLPIPVNNQEIVLESENFPYDKESAKLLLSNTDWYILREIETGKKIPEEILAKRAAAREQLNSK